MLPLEAVVPVFHQRFQIGHGRFHGLGALQDFGYNEFVVAEEAADFVHSGHQRALMMSRGVAPSASFFSRSSIKPSLLPSMM